MSARKIVQCSILFVVLTCTAADDYRANEGRVYNAFKNSRRFFDILLGKFRPCGNCACGKANRSGARFLGGEYTNSHEFPWLTNIHVKNNLLVSGVLINDRYVLTAASPLIGATPPEIKVALGEYDRCRLDVSSANMSVETIIPHPDFSYESRAHDLALIRMSRSTHFDRRISPICLPDAGSTYLGQVGTLTGWTETSSANSSSSGAGNSTFDDDAVESRTCRPRKLGLPILSRRECLQSGVRPENYHEDSGCIGVVGVSPIVCNNDVGTSVLHRSYSGYYDLVGIISDLNNCNNNNSSTVGTAIFTRIGPHVDWIYQTTKDACYCSKPFDVPEIKSLMYAY